MTETEYAMLEDPMGELLDDPDAGIDDPEEDDEDDEDEDLGQLIDPA